MTSRPPLSPLVVNEVRALLPAWLACLAGIIVSAGTSVWPLGDAGVGAYLLGIAALGALSIGHDYTHRTLPLLLSLPQPRERLFLVKLVVLTSMLLAVAALANALVFPRMQAPESIRLAFFLLPLVGVCVAPWLTMTFRSAIAGAVFTLALPGTLLTVSELLYFAIFRHLAPAEFDTLVLWRGTMTCCVVGAVMSWRTFLRLEAIDGPPAGLSLPRWLQRPHALDAAAPPFTRRHPIWLLMKKELRLQQTAFVVAGLYVLGWIAAISLQRVLPHVREIFDPLSILYVLLIALLIGAVASAEERQLGTLEAQLLQPVATAQQWAVKVGVVTALALLLALVLPETLVSRQVPAPLVLDWACATVALTMTGLYLSSACATGLWAMLMSLPLVFTAVWWIQMLRVRGAARLGRVPNGSLVRFDTALEPAMAIAFFALLLWLALANHRSAERTGRRLWLQGLWLAASLTVGTVVAVLAGR